MLRLFIHNFNCFDYDLVHTPTEIARPCDPSPCGMNAVCREKQGAGSCTCLPDYFGDPYTGCRPECMQNSECDNTKACINQKCRDPCPGVCGNNAQCFVVNHSPSCECFSGYTGNPSIECREIPRSKFKQICIQLQCSRLTYTHNYSDDYIPPVNPCQPSPCGPYSSCKTHDGHAVCSCLQNYYGSPPSCKPECSVSSDCSSNKACENERCIDPCPGTCGFDARCNVVNHSPICSCPPNYSGDPFVRCYKEDRKTANNPSNLTPKP